MNAGYSTMSTAEMRSEIAGIRAFRKKMAKSPRAARAFLVRTGILDKSGNLAARYKSKR